MEQLLSFAGVNVDRKLLARAIAQHTPALMNITLTTTNMNPAMTPTTATPITSTSTISSSPTIITNDQKGTQRHGLSMEVTSNQQPSVLLLSLTHLLLFPFFLFSLSVFLT